MTKFSQIAPSASPPAPSDTLIGPASPVDLKYTLNQIATTVAATTGFLTPQMFGAKGDGTTDDTTAIRAAFAAATSLKQPLLVVGGLTYVIDSIVLSSNLKICGDGNTTFKLKNNASGPMFSWPASISNVTFKSLILDGNISGQSGAPHNLIHSIFYDGNFNASAVSKCVFEGVTINNVDGCAFGGNVPGANFAQFTDCVWRDIVVNSHSQSAISLTAIRGAVENIRVYNASNSAVRGDCYGFIAFACVDSSFRDIVITVTPTNFGPIADQIGFAMSGGSTNCVVDHVDVDCAGNTLTYFPYSFDTGSNNTLTNLYARNCSINVDFEIFNQTDLQGANWHSVGDLSSTVGLIFDGCNRCKLKNYNYLGTTTASDAIRIDSIVYGACNDIQIDGYTIDKQGEGIRVTNLSSNIRFTNGYMKNLDTSTGAGNCAIYMDGATAVTNLVIDGLIIDGCNIPWHLANLQGGLLQNITVLNATFPVTEQTANCTNISYFNVSGVNSVPQSWGSLPGTSFVNVKDIGAIGQDRLYTNIIGGSGYTGGSASNLLATPEDYTSGSWHPGNLTVASNVILDPRNNLLAAAITETTAATASHGIGSSLSSSFTANANVVYDVEIKPNNRTWFQIEVYDSGSAVFTCTFNLTGNGVVGSRLAFGGATFGSASVVALANGWYRCAIQGNIGGSTQVFAQVNPILGDLLYFDGASDPNQFYTGTSSIVAFYLGLSRVYATTTYLGSTFIAGDNIFSGVALTGGSGTGARANIVVGLGQVLGVASYCPGSGYVVGDTLSCAAADIGGTGSGFTCQVQTIGNDTAAIQAALDSGNGAPITIYFPPGTYNAFPSDALGSNCLTLRHNNVTLLGAGRETTTIQFFVSGGRHPETSYDIPSFGGNAGFVWRGRGFQLTQSMQNLEWRGLRLTGLCRRHNNRWPLGGADPQVISGGDPLGLFGDGDGWDESHQCIARFNRVTSIDRGLRIVDCELDSWKGEIVGSIGDFTTPPDDTTQWTWWIERNYLHDTHADCISSSGNAMILGNELAWGSNGVEEGTAICHTVFRNNHFHDHTHGITLVVGSDTGASSTSTGQQIVDNNFFERCYLNGIFILDFQCNVQVDSNVFVDCGVTSSATGGAVNTSLLSGSQRFANIFITRNLIYSHVRNIQSPLSLGMGLFTGGSLQGVYIEDNKVAQTPNAQSLSYAPTVPWSDNLASGTYAEVFYNDMRTASGGYNPSGAVFPLRLDNVLDQQIRYAEIRLAGQFDKTNNTLADIPNLTETISDSTAVWFEAMLYVIAPAGGAKVAVVATGSVGSTRYDVEMWAGATIDAASGQGTASGTPFASAAAITKIKIAGVLQVQANSQGTVLKLQFAQNSTNTTPSSVLANSWFKVRNRS
jgi:hypothetical protein